MSSDAPGLASTRSSASSQQLSSKSSPMALPKSLQGGLTPDELTFLAEDDTIDIVPLFSMSRVRLLAGIYGPFTPPSRATVPLWLALSLKRKNKCRIVPPEWLQVGGYSRKRLLSHRAQACLTSNAVDVSSCTVGGSERNTSGRSAND